MTEQIEAAQPSDDELLREARSIIMGLESQLDHAGCTCTFPSDICCAYGHIDSVLDRIDARLNGEGTSA